MAREEHDAAMEQECEASLAQLHHRTRRMFVHSLLSGEADHHSCFLELQAGSGTSLRSGLCCRAYAHCSMVS